MHPEEQHLPFTQAGSTTIFSFMYQSCVWPRSDPLFWQNPCSGCNSGIDLVVALKYHPYNPKRASIANHLSTLSKCTDIYTSKYDNLIFLGDFNAGVEDTDIKYFCSSYSFTSMLNKATCYSPDKPTCTDLILTNCPGSFQNSCVVETGLSDFHKMVVTVMKTSYRKSQPKMIRHRNYKNFS